MSGILIIIGRVLGLTAALFIGMFGLDVFFTGAPWWQNLLGFAVHSLPSLVLLAVLLVSWRWPLVGGTLYLLLAIVPFVGLSNPVWVNALLATPLVLAGAFLVAGALVAKRG